MKTRSFLVLGIIIMHLSVIAQVKIGTNPTSINSASILELETTNKGFVLPRVSIGDVSSSSPLASGLLTGTTVYNTNSSTTGGSGTGIYLWDGTKWVTISTGASVSSSSWLLTGNSGLNASSNFIGTTDAVDFVARTANTERMRILGAVSGSSKAGWIGMGITIPRSSLDVTGHYANKNVITIENSSTSGFSSVDMLDSAGNLAATFGYGNLGTGAFGGKAYFNGYGNDFLFTRGSSYDLLMKGNNGYVGLNTNAPSERLHVVGNIYLNGAFMPGGTAGTSGYILTSAGAGISPTWTSPNSLVWGLTGNSGTSYATNFLGTTDNISMRFRTNNVQRMIIDSLGRIGIGLNNPAYTLSVLSASNPLYLSGVQPTAALSTDSVLTIYNGIVKKTPFSAIAASTTNTLSLSTNTLTSTVNGIAATSNAVSGVSNASSANTLSTTVNGVTSATVPIINTNTKTWTQAGGLTTTVNGVASNITPATGTVSNILGYNTLGTPVYQTASGILSGATTNTLNLSTNTLTSTVNGVAATSNAVSSVTNISSANTLGTTVNGITGITVPIINTNTNALTQAGGLVTTVNGVAATTSIAAGTVSNVLGYNTSGAPVYQPLSNVSLSTAWNLIGNSGTTASNFLGTTDNVSMRFRTNNIQRLIIDSLGKVGIGISNPSYALSVLSGSNPLYLSGVQATAAFATDSVLTIFNGVVKKAPYSALTGTFWSLTGNSGTSYATNFLGTSDNVSLRFRTNNTERMILDSLGNAGIGSSNFDAVNREKLLVDAGTATSHTIAGFTGSIDDYFQINLQNKSSTANASTDYVATADDGTDSTYYVDMGINGSNYAFSLDNWGNAHDAYLYSNSKNLYIGTQATGSDVVFLVGGGRALTNSALRIKGSNSNIVVGKGEASTTPVGNTLRAPSGYGGNITGGTLTVAGGAGAGSGAGGNLYLGSGVSAGTGTSGIVTLNTASTERMRIDASGNIGIGTTNPSYLLSVLAASNPLYLSGVQATSTLSSDSILTIYNGVVKKTAFSALPASTTNTLTLSGNTLTSTVNGIAATSNAVSGVSNTSSANTLSTTVNGVTGTTVPIINTNTKSWTQSGGLTTTINGVSSTVTPANGTVSNILGYNAAGAPVYQPLSNINLSTAWNITGNAGTSYATNFLGTTDNISMRFRTNNTQRMIIDSLGKIGIGTSSPSSDLTLYQSSGSGSSKGFTFTGNSISGTNSGTGFLMSLGYNTVGNKQLWFGDGDYAGNASGSFARFVQTGAVFPVFDAVSGDGILRRYLAFGVAGDANSGVIFGGDNTAVNPGSQVWDNGNMTIGAGYKSYAAPSSGLLVQGNVGIGTTAPSSALSVLAASNPLYLSGVLATSTFSSDSILTINAGVVKKTPYSSLPTVSGAPWQLSGNSISAGQFLGTTNAQALVFKYNSTSAGYLDANNTSFGTSATSTSGTSNTAIGYSSTAANSATAVGASSNAANVANTAIGNNATANGSDHETAIGASSQATAQYNTALGYNAQAITGAYATAVGTNSSSTGYQSIALGTSTISNADQTVSLGYSAQATAQFGVAIGNNAKAQASNSIAIGSNALIAQTNSMLLGNTATSNFYVGIGTATPGAKLHIVGNSGGGYNPLQISGLPAGVSGTDNLLSINSSGVVGYITPTAFNNTYWSLSGNAASAGNFLGTTNTTPLQFKFNSTNAGYLDANNTSFGTSATSTSGTSNTAIGYLATAANGSTAIGASSVANTASNVAVGNSAIANNSSNETAIGASAQASAQYNTVIGYNALATVSSQATAVGASAQAQAQNNTAIGYSARATNSDKITAIGASAQASFQYNTVLGYNALATTNNQSTAIGSSSQAQAQNATALGYNAKANANNSTAIGYNASTTQANALVLGDATSTVNVGIGTATPNTSTKLDVDGNFKLGDVGAVVKNLATGSGTVNVTVAANTQYEFTVNLSTTLTSTNGTAVASPAFDLPLGFIVSSVRISATNQVKIRIINFGNSNTMSGTFYVTATEF